MNSMGSLCKAKHDRGGDCEFLSEQQLRRKEQKVQFGTQAVLVDFVLGGRPLFPFTQLSFLNVHSREVIQLGGWGEETQEVTTAYTLLSRRTSTARATRGVGRVLGLMRALLCFRPGCSL